MNRDYRLRRQTILNYLYSNFEKLEAITEYKIDKKLRMDDEELKDHAEYIFWRNLDLFINIEELYSYSTVNEHKYLIEIADELFEKIDNKCREMGVL